MRRTITATLAAAVVLLGASTAQAAPAVDVTYDLEDSSAISVVNIALTGVILQTLAPPQLSGTMKIRYASNSASGLVPGPSTLLTFNLSVKATVGLTFATVSGGTGQTVVNTGSLRFHLTSPVTGGTLLSGGTVDPLGGIGQLRLTGTVHCYLLCGFASAPVSTPVPIATVGSKQGNFFGPPGNQTFSQPLGPLYGAFGSTVTGTQYANFYFEVNDPAGYKVNVIATTFIVGREILREPVPEPATLPLLGISLAGLAAMSLRTQLTRMR